MTTRAIERAFRAVVKRREQLVHAKHKLEDAEEHWAAAIEERRLEKQEEARRDG